jgi:DNA-binding MarR family transcriptional regulator
VAPLVSRWIERLLAGHSPPLTLSQYLALRAIAEEPVSGSELALRTGVSGPAVSQLITTLHGAGLVEREVLPGDRRRQTLQLSSAGQRVFASSEELLCSRLAALLESLPRPESDALSRALPRVQAELAGTPPPRRPRSPGPPPPPQDRSHKRPRRGTRR